MDFGVDIGELNLPIAWNTDDRRSAPRRDMRRVVSDFFEAARTAEDLGFDAVWLGDHMIFPEHVDYARSYYTGTPTGRNAGVADTRSTLMEVLTQLAALSGVTQRVKLGTKVLVLPLRHPLLTAKMLATLDVLSNGRVILGAGVGWLREEFDAFGAASYEHRGSLSDEYLRIFKEVWTSDVPAFEGRWYRFSGFAFQPRPLQAPHIPIWIGGHTPAALRRVARLGDGWYPTGIQPEAYARLLDELRRQCEVHGRDPAEIMLAAHIRVTIDQHAPRASSLEIRSGPDVSLSFRGGPEHVVALLQSYQRLGVRHISFDLTLEGRAGTPEGRLEAMRVVAQEVLPALREAPDR